MNTLIVNQQQVERLLPMAECIGVMEDVLTALARDDCLLPLRSIMWLERDVAALGLMPSAWRSARIIGLKAVTYFPGNEGTALDSHQGAVMLFDGNRGNLLAVIDATSITAIRTAAVSGVATKVLARNESKNLAIIGSGVQARMHLRAMLLCRRIARVRVCSKSHGQAQRFADEMSRECAAPLDAVASPEEAVEGADVICTTTSSRRPVLMGTWLRPGTHVNAVGSSTSSARELDGPAVKMSRLFVDRRESAAREAGDFVIARQEGLVNDDHIIAEIGEVLDRSSQGRRSPDEITLFKSVGLAVEDLAAGWHVYKKALQQDGATIINFGGARHAAP